MFGKEKNDMPMFNQLKGSYFLCRTNDSHVLDQVRICAGVMSLNGAGVRKEVANPTGNTNARKSATKDMNYCASSLRSTIAAVSSL
jgi:hypothetical protein